MENVKNESVTVCGTAQTTTLKPLKFQGFGVSEATPEACGWSQDLGPAAAAAEPGAASKPGDFLVGLLGIGATALLLTYGNLLMDALFKLLGI